MSIPFDLSGVVYSTSAKLVACLTLPSGLVAPAGVTLTGGTVSGTTNINTSTTQIFAGMTETPAGSGIYDVTADIAGMVLPDTTTRPYTVEARVVPSGTDLTTYATIAAAFAASTTVAYSIGAAIYGGFLRGGVWGNDIAGKVLGGGSSTIVAAGAWSLDNSGNALATATAISALAGQTLIVQSPVGSGTLTIVEEDSYLAADGRALQWTKPNGANWPSDLTTWSITFTAAKTPDNGNAGNATITAPGSVLVATGSGQRVQVELTTSLTTRLAVGIGNQGYVFDVVAKNGSDRATLIRGTMSVVANVTP